MGTPKRPFKVFPCQFVFWQGPFCGRNLFKLPVVSHSPGVRNEGGACDHSLQQGTAVKPEEKD